MTCLLRVIVVRDYELTGVRRTYVRVFAVVCSLTSRTRRLSTTSTGSRRSAWDRLDASCSCNTRRPRNSTQWRYSTRSGYLL